MTPDSAAPGIDHVTVVPTNYPPEESEEGDADGGDRRDGDGPAATDRR